MKLNYLAIIPARSGSKRIPHKNVAILGNTPLIIHTIIAACETNSISEVIVTTDDPEVAQISCKMGVKIDFPRPTELSSDTSQTFDVIKYLITKYEQDANEIENILILQPTSPFRNADHIYSAINYFEQSKADTLISVRLVHDHPYWLWKKEGGKIVPFFSRKHVALSRDQLTDLFIENGAIYIMKRSVLETGSIYGVKIVEYLMDDLSSLDIDNPIDLIFARFLISRGLTGKKYEKKECHRNNWNEI